jgi:hypothetical protein
VLAFKAPSIWNEIVKTEHTLFKWTGSTIVFSLPSLPSNESAVGDYFSWKKSSEHVLLSQLSNRLTSDPSSLFFSQSFGFFRLFVVFKFYSCWWNLWKGFCPLKFSKESPEVKIEIRKNGKRWKSSGSAKPLQEQGQGYRGKIDQNFQFL